MNITHNGWALTVDIHGGRIVELSCRGVKVWGTYQRMDGKTGNTHLCVPSFDKEGEEKYGLPFHGLVRNLEWLIDSSSSNHLIISCQTSPTKPYSARLFIEQEFVINDTFTHIVRITNRSGAAVPVNVGCHYYWDTPDGWNRAKINGEQIKKGIETNGYIALQENNAIEFPHAAYFLTTKGFHSSVLWTSFIKEENEEKKYSHDFCCIEPVIGWPNYFDSKESMLEVGSKREVSVSLSIKEEVNDSPPVKQLKANG